MRDEGSVGYTATVRDATDRAVFDGEAAQLLRYGALRAWEVLHKDQGEELLKLLDAGKCVAMALTQSDAPLVPYEFERAQGTDQYYCYVRTRIQNPTSSYLVGMIRRHATGPNAYDWVIYPVNWQQSSPGQGEGG